MFFGGGVLLFFKDALVIFTHWSSLFQKRRNDNFFSLPLPKAHLVPSDEITVYYRCQPEGEYLHSVIQAHTDFILATTKAPLLPSPVPNKAVVIIEEKTQVWKKRLKATRSMLSLLNDYHVFVIPQAITHTLLSTWKYQSILVFT